MKAKKVIAIFAVLALIGFVFAATANVRASEPDYHFEETLAADGSDDTGEIYKVTRANDTQEAYVEVKAYMSEREVYVIFENIDSFKIYFNETDVNFDEVMPFISAVGVEIDIIISNTEATLSGEFHSVPNPDVAYLDDVEWEDWSYENEIFKFENLETSERTITLEYLGSFMEYMAFAINAIIAIWMFSFIFLAIKVVIDSLTEAKEW